MKYKALTITMGLLLSAGVAADTELEQLRSEVDSLNKKAKEWEAYQNQKNKMVTDVASLNEKAREWEEWKAPKTLVHMAGFADVSFISATDLCQGSPAINSPDILSGLFFISLICFTSN